MEENHQITTPNLFEFATKELSQDAFLCWLLSWADCRLADVDPGLHEMGRHFLKSIARKCGRDIPVEVPDVHVEVQKQYKSIDVLAKISLGTTKYVLAIEDKTHTTMLGDQLCRYRSTVEKDFSDRERLFVYFKTGAISQAAVAEKAGYTVYSRKDFLEVLGSNPNNFKNSILRDFHEHLSVWDRRFEAYRRKPVSEWVKDDWAWEGFLSHLQSEMSSKNGIEADWSYQANQSGGEYVCCWGGGYDFCHGNAYVEIHKKLGKRNSRYFLGFKVVNLPADANRREVRWNLYQSIMATAERFGWANQIDKPDRFGSGNSMVFCETKLQDCWLATDMVGCVDVSGTIDRLGEADRLLEAAVVRYESSNT